MKRFKLIAVLIVISTFITACNTNNNIDISSDTIDEIVESIEETANDKKEYKDKQDSKEEPASDEESSINDITSNAGVVNSSTDDIKTKIDNTDIFSGKVIDEIPDIEIYELPDGLDNNNTAQLYDGNYNKFLYELNSYLMEISRNITIISEFNDENTFNNSHDNSIDYYINKLKILMESLYTKDKIIKSVASEDAELSESWNDSYDMLNNIYLDTTIENIKDSLEDAQSKIGRMSSIINNRIQNYDYYADIYNNTENEVEIIE